MGLDTFCTPKVRASLRSKFLARLIFGLSRRSDIIPALKQLHWLPEKFRIIFKVPSTTHSIFHQCSPPYLKDLVTFSVSGPSVVNYGHQQPGCPSNMNSVRSTRFGPDIWNSLPVNIRLTDSHGASVVP